MQLCKDWFLTISDAFCGECCFSGHWTGDGYRGMDPRGFLKQGRWCDRWCALEKEQIWSGEIMSSIKYEQELDHRKPNWVHGKTTQRTHYKQNIFTLNTCMDTHSYSILNMTMKWGTIHAAESVFKCEVLWHGWPWKYCAKWKKPSWKMMEQCLISLPGHFKGREIYGVRG